MADAIIATKASANRNTNTMRDLNAGQNSVTLTNRKSFSVSDRGRLIERMAAQVFDLVIIGGGITGAGVARDAASRGLSVALVEAKDFAVGTSSRSSKLIH